MAKKKNLIPLILLGIGAGVGGYFYYTRVMKPKQGAKNKPLPLPKPTVMAGALTQSFMDQVNKSNKKKNRFTSGPIVSIPRYLSPGSTMSNIKTKPRVKTTGAFPTKSLPRTNPFVNSSPIIYTR